MHGMLIKSMEVSAMGPLFVFGNGGKEITGTNTGGSFASVSFATLQCKDDCFDWYP